MNLLSAYVPADRYLALAHNSSLPDRTVGTALFADISGFTPLAESLVHRLGPRRGVEELTRLLNEVYGALISQVEAYGGVVVGFSGDAVTCWFDRSDGRAALRGLACALAMQQAMERFAQVGTPAGEPVSLGMKAALASGPTRRFVVGDPAVQLLDVLAGATLARMAAGETLAGRGEVLADAATVAQVNDQVSIQEWRTDEASGERFALIAGMKAGLLRPQAVESLPPNLPADQLRSWLLPVIYERLVQGLGEFLTELRPVTALFLRFEGIDYDGDGRAGEKLDAYVRWVQETVTRYGGSLLEVVVGDKGSYLYAAFGAPAAHEDDDHRAAGAALELQGRPAALAFVQPVQVGISRGLMRVGAYGGSSRRTYGVLGDEANVAARLMQHAAPGETLVSGRIHSEIEAAFEWAEKVPVRVKGKAEPIPAFALLGARRRPALRLHEPAYALPMVGREAELKQIAARLDEAAHGRGQVVGITAEAGMGKSRLLAEALTLVRTRGLPSFGGECQSYGTHTPYLVWREIWRAFFGLEARDPPEAQIALLEKGLAEIGPDLAARLPLLGIVVDLPIPDNELTASLDAKLRKESLEALLVDCVKARAAAGPLVLVLEDMHWADPLSRDLGSAIGRAIAGLPVLMLIAFRPPGPVLSGAGLPHYTEIPLADLPPAEAEGLIDQRLRAWSENLSGLPVLKSRVLERAQGNPFYIEELLNYLRDRGVLRDRGHDLVALELPDSLHSLILSRIDQLTERERVTLKVASVIGRQFRVSWLCGYYPAIGSLEQVKADLEELRRLDLTPLDVPEPELIYLFKHIVTQEVAYESLSYATRALLHEQLARWLETTMADTLSVDLLAYHYAQSDNLDKKQEYLRRAGEAAQAAYAHGPALDYYQRLLPLLSGQPGERIQVLLGQGTVLEWTGRWGEAESSYQEALALASELADGERIADCQGAIGSLLGSRGEYDAALDWLEQARSRWAARHNEVRLAGVLAEMGYLVARQGDYARARGYLRESQKLALACGDKKVLAKALNNLGTVAWNQGDYQEAAELGEQALALLRETGDYKAVAGILNNLGNIAVDRGDWVRAQTLHAESLAHKREIGDKRGIAMSLNNLGNVALLQGDYEAARRLYGESLGLRRELGDRWGIGMSLNNLGSVAMEQGDSAAAQALFQESLALKREIGDRRGVVVTLSNIGMVLMEQGESEAARAFYQESLVLAQETGDKLMVAYDLLGLAGVAIAQAGAGREQAARAVRLASAAQALLASIGAPMEEHEGRLYRRTVEQARACLDPADFAADWAAGQSLLPEQAAAEALR